MTAIYYRRDQSTPLECSQLDHNFEAVLNRNLHQGTQLSSTISDLYTTVENYDFINALQQCCTNLTNQITELQDSIFGDGELSTLISNLRNELLLEIAELETDLNVLTSRVNIVETSIATINTSLTSLGNSITGLATTKANIANPTFTGIPKAPTPLTGADSAQIATVGFVNNVAAGIIDIIPSSIPIGSVLPYSGASVSDPNYVLANGQAISRTTYADYFALVGITYGTGDGNTTFNVPNLQQRIPVGTGTGYVIGATGGSATHTLTNNEMPSHTHTAYPHTHTPIDLGHRHELYEINNNVNNGVTGVQFQPFGSVGGYVNGVYPGNPVGTDFVSSKSTGITLALTQDVLYNNGGSQPHNNMQPYIVLNYIVKVK